MCSLCFPLGPSALSHVVYFSYSLGSSILDVHFSVQSFIFSALPLFTSLRSLTFKSGGVLSREGAFGEKIMWREQRTRRLAGLQTKGRLLWLGQTQDVLLQEDKI